MTDFDIKAFGDDWLLTPMNRTARTWCQLNLAKEFRKAGDGYVMDHEHLLLVVEEFAER